MPPWVSLRSTHPTELRGVVRVCLPAVSVASLWLIFLRFGLARHAVRRSFSEERSLYEILLGMLIIYNY